MMEIYWFHHLRFQGLALTTERHHRTSYKRHKAGRVTGAIYKIASWWKLASGEKGPSFWRSSGDQGSCCWMPLSKGLHRVVCKENGLLVSIFQSSHCFKFSKDISVIFLTQRYQQLLMLLHAVICGCFTMNQLHMILHGAYDIALL